MKKKVFAIVICVCLAFVSIPRSVLAVGGHNHSWSSSWTASDTHHWHDCNSDNCTVTEDSQKGGYGEHDFSQYPYRCTVCQYSIAHEHYGGTATCQWNATCEGCGTIYGDTNPNNHQHPNGFAEKIDGSNHKIICECGYVFKASEPHNFTSWDNNGDGTQERWCEDCLYAETRKIQNDQTSQSDKYEIGTTKFLPDTKLEIPSDATFTVGEYTPRSETVFGIFGDDVSITDADAEKMKTSIPLKIQLSLIAMATNIAQAK